MHLPYVLPYVIDNRAHTLADVLNDLLHSDAVHALDVATAYVNIGGFDLVHDGADERHPLEGLASFRLLLGSEPGAPQDLGLGLPQALRHDLDEAPFDQETYRQVETLIRFLRREQVAARLCVHVKAYLCFADRAPGDRFTPVAGIVGSSNFIRAGLTTNQELNLTHKSVIDESEADDIEAQAAVEPLLDTCNTLQRIADEDGSVLDELEKAKSPLPLLHKKGFQRHLSNLRAALAELNFTSGRRGLYCVRH